MDTGSSVAAIPCKNFCKANQCGKHINSLYDAQKSTAFEVYDCHKVDCQCEDGNKCRFYQGYAEGSRYEGYIVKDQLYFGEDFRVGRDEF